MNLGAAFPENFRDSHAADCLEVGGVIRLYDVNAAKVKILVVVGENVESNSIACCYINSEVNHNVNYTAELKGLQHAVSSSTYDFLSHDSYLDCSKITVHSKADVLDQIRDNPGDCKGALLQADKNVVLSNLKRATTLSAYKKRSFGLA